MSRFHPQHRLAGPARVPGVVAAALIGLMVGGLSASTVEAGTPSARTTASLHRAKPLKTLPALKVAKPAATSDMVSPYARAAAQRNESGRRPSGHAYLAPRSIAHLTGQPAQ
jgi:hypothetical protein